MCACRVIQVAALTVVLLLGVVAHAEAYVDPGVGALVWQFVAALGFGALFLVRQVQQWFAALPRRLWPKLGRRRPGTKSEY